MKVGFQGYWTSNSEIAARQFVKCFDNVVELIPLISSQKVVNALKSCAIDYGVMAIKNNIGGVVEETQKVLNDDLKMLSKTKVKIHHCLFVKNKNINIKDIKFVASHRQALLQTKKNISQIFINPILKCVEDTAISAKYLKQGKLSDEYAVICSKHAGLDNDLFLLKENIEDKKSITTFGLFILK